MKRTQATPNNDETLQDHLVRRLNCSRNEAKRLLDARRVFVNGRRVWMAKHRLKPDDKVEILQPASTPDRLTEKHILHRDDHYVILDKPPGWLTNGPDSAESALRQLLDHKDLRAVHRLDRDTSGCLLFAMTREAFDRMVPLFKEREVDKVYHALVSERVPENVSRITHPIDNQPARTLLRVLSATDTASHLQVKIETGRTHQIRKHLAGLGHPVLGDKQYATRKEDSKLLRSAPRQMLHASTLSFPCPITGKTIRAKAPLPKDLRRLMGKLGLR